MASTGRTAVITNLLLPPKPYLLLLHPVREQLTFTSTFIPFQNCLRYASSLHSGLQPADGKNNCSHDTELFLALPQSNHSINSISKVKSGGKKSPSNLNRQKPLPFIPAVTVRLSTHRQNPSLICFWRIPFFTPWDFSVFMYLTFPFPVHLMWSYNLCAWLLCSLETLITNTRAEASPPSLGLACFALVNITISGLSQRKPEQEQLLLKHLHWVPAEQLHTNTNTS